MTTNSAQKMMKTMDALMERVATLESARRGQDTETTKDAIESQREPSIHGWSSGLQSLQTLPDGEDAKWKKVAITFFIALMLVAGANPLTPNGCIDNTSQLRARH